MNTYFHCPLNKKCKKKIFPGVIKCVKNPWIYNFLYYINPPLTKLKHRRILDIIYTYLHENTWYLFATIISVLNGVRNDRN